MKKYILVGTSGYNYPHWRKIFYPKGLTQSNWLSFYAEHFNTVELNVTFYRLPFKKNFKNWYKKTPKDFSFVIKGSRYITHIKRLKECKTALGNFFKNSSALKGKLVCVLWQLPPSLKMDIKRLEDFVKIIKKNYTHCRHSFEFRNETWFNKEIYDILKANNINLCIADSPDLTTPSAKTSDLIYLRFHGGKELYSSNYSEKELRTWASEAKKMLRGKKTLLAFFNNDARGFAVKNALRFRKLLNEKL